MHRVRVSVIIGLGLVCMAGLLSSYSVVRGEEWEAPPVNDAQNFGGLPEGPGRDIVFYHCAICHSTRLVLQQRLSRGVWDETLDWMVEEQGMNELEPEIRKIVLDYLSTHLSPETPR